MVTQKKELVSITSIGNAEGPSLAILILKGKAENLVLTESINRVFKGKTHATEIK